MQISLPEPLTEYVEGPIAEEGYSSASEYFIELVREDQRREIQEKLEALLIERINGGKSAPFTKMDLEAVRGILHARVVPKGKA